MPALRSKRTALGLLAVLVRRWAWCGLARAARRGPGHHPEDPLRASAAAPSPPTRASSAPRSAARSSSCAANEPGPPRRGLRRGGRRLLHAGAGHRPDLGEGHLGRGGPGTRGSPSRCCSGSSTSPTCCCAASPRAASARRASRRSTGSLGLAVIPLNYFAIELFGESRHPPRQPRAGQPRRRHGPAVRARACCDARGLRVSCSCGASSSASCGPRAGRADRPRGRSGRAHELRAGRLRRDARRAARLRALRSRAKRDALREEISRRAAPNRG